MSDASADITFAGIPMVRAPLSFCLSSSLWYIHWSGIRALLSLGKVQVLTASTCQTPLLPVTPPVWTTLKV